MKLMASTKVRTFLKAGLWIALWGIIMWTIAGCDGGESGEDVQPRDDAGAGDLSDVRGDAGADVGNDVRSDARGDAGRIEVLAVDLGLGRTDSGAVYCAVPSPAGDAVNPGTGRTARQELALELETASYLAFVVVTNSGDSAAICSGSAVGASCADVSRDFAGEDGVAHCFELVAQDGDVCRPSVDGKKTCRLSLLGSISASAPKPRATAICSAGGAFVGWWCNNGAS